jgi:hypothetical protein
MRARVAAIAVLPAMLVLQGCGSESDLEKSVRKSIDKGTTAADVQFVACPKNVKTGQTFKCKAVIPVDVTQLDDNGNLRWQITNLSGKPGATGVTGPSLGATGVTAATGATGASGLTGPTRGPSFPGGATGAKGSEKRFVTFRNTAEGYSIRYPFIWNKTGSGAAVRLIAVSPGRFANINSTEANKKMTPASLQKEMRSSQGVSDVGKASRTTIGRAQAVTITYIQRSGKFDLFMRRYVFVQNKKRVTLDIGSPKKSAQAPGFVQRAKKIANSFRWL